jgi:hypothetical protein
MKVSLKFLMAIILPLVSSCSNRHLIHDNRYLQLVESSFRERRTLAANRAGELFSVFDRSLSARQKEALKFLYSFMPLSDLADYSGEFFLANVNVSLRALDESPWGKDIPEEIFLHYVLPCRVNNENLDSFRIVYYDEIMSRVKNASIIDAALEINHWCHEKVTYQAADIRTSAPMSTILSARGRCGEESTFTVAALRTVGIPARQVYTPRWAHTDDNHAWVEVWSGGKWHYMGACEPEPVIDRGWFTEPARRAMLIHTKSFGAPSIGENAVCRYKYFTEVNNLSGYAVTKTIFVKVTDRNNMPVKNARVEYQLFNYAEFFPLAVVPADENGLSRFETGLGDLLIWASDKQMFNYRKISAGETDTLHLVLDKKAGGSYSVDLDLDVPLALSPLAGPSQDLIDANTKRINSGNEIRTRYTDSWIKTGEARSFAIARNIDTGRVTKIFERSMGNYREVRSFLSVTPDSLLIPAISMLELLPDKDLRDTKAAVLSDHLLNTHLPGKNGEYTGIFLDYVLNPRVANELLASWRSYFKKNLPSGLIQDAPSNPLLISQYLEKNIKIDDDENYYRTPLTPIGVSELKVSDSFSRDICFVAICRSLGIPSRLEPGSNVPQFFLNSEWNDLFFSDRTKPSGSKGYLKLMSAETKPEPEYYLHFTLAKFDNGRYNTLSYDYNRKISDFKEELALAPGSYMLVTGNRLAGGRILSELSFFDLSEGEHKTVAVKIRHDSTESRILGKIDMQSIAGLIDNSSKDKAKILERGVVVLWIEPDKEPTRHIFNDLPRLKQEFDDWGGCFLFLTDPSLKWGGFKNEELKSLPANLVTGTDNRILNSSFKSFDPSGLRLPFVVMADKNGDILYTSSGYRIGIGEQILRYTSGLK